ncbi:MAG: hypothetical protein KL787_05855 [Taibaiella sp.]|nr:hypothetical protein [Taibaiella sp.]
MKRKTVVIFIVYTSLLFLTGCHSSEIYYKLDAISMSTFQYNWSYNDSTRSYELEQTKIEEGKLYPYDALYWKIDCELGYAGGPGLNLIQKSYAFQFDQYFYNMYALKGIVFITLSDYNADHLSHDPINDIIGFVDFRNDTLSIREMIDSWQSEAYSYYPEIISSYYIYLKEKPGAVTDFSFQVIYEFEHGIFIHQTAYPVQIF